MGLHQPEFVGTLTRKEGNMEIVGYSYEADTYCVDCATETEGDEVHPIFDTDEAGDTPDHCGDCGELLDTSWHNSTIEYAIESLAEYAVYGRGNSEVLDVWLDKLCMCGLSAKDEAIKLYYDEVRVKEDHE